MLVDSIVITLFLISAATAVTLVGRKLSILSSIDVESIPAERDKRAKTKIIEMRMSRKFQSFLAVLALASEPLQRGADFASRRLRALYAWIIEIREKHRRHAIVGGATVSLENLSPEERTERLLAEGSDLTDKEQYEDAERRFIDVLSLDSHSCAAYEGLARIYRQKKEWAQARDVLGCAIKLMKEQHKGSEESDRWAVSYAELLNDAAEVYVKLDESLKALACAKEAVELQPNNPKYLDALLDIHVALGQRLKAETVLDQLRKANPENEKLDELEDRIKALSY